MKMFFRKLIKIGILLSLICLMSYVAKNSLDKRFTVSKNKVDEKNKICDLKVLDALIEYEQSVPSNEATNQENDLKKGSIVLTGEFDKMNNQDLEELVCNTLTEIGYDKISEQSEDRTLVTIINKIDPSSTNQAEERNNIESSPLFKCVNESHKFAEEILKDKKLSKQCNPPWLMRNFQNNELGIKSYIIEVSKNISVDSDDKKEDQIDLERKINNKGAKEHFVDIRAINKLSRLGPKVFMSSSNETK